MSSHWNPGDAVLLREVWRGKVWTARPITIVRDTPDLVALYLAAGTRWKRAFRPDGGFARLPTEPWVLGDTEWAGMNTLWLNVPGAAHSVLAFWSAPGWVFSGWYVNLEDPFRRTRLGFDYMDMALDIIGSPDLSTWTWKDEDELAVAEAQGMIPPDKARAIRAEGQQVIELAHARRAPFDGGWESWRPDPAWRIPELPDGWDAVAHQ